MKTKCIYEKIFEKIIFFSVFISILVLIGYDFFSARANPMIFGGYRLQEPYILSTQDIFILIRVGSFGRHVTC